METRPDTQNAAYGQIPARSDQIPRRGTTYFQDVCLFHLKFGLPTPSDAAPDFLDTEAFCFRYGFMQEELAELIDAYRDNDIARAADALADEIYVALGTAAFMRIDFDAFWKTNVGHSARSYFEDIKQHVMSTLTVPTMPALDPFCFRLGKMADGLARFASVHQTHLHTAGCAGALASIVYNALVLAEEMKLPFNEIWDEVQGANMKKTRAKKAGDSTRSTTLDVIKPKGWMPPNVAGILNKHGAAIPLKIFRINRHILGAYDLSQAIHLYKMHRSDAIEISVELSDDERVSNTWHLFGGATYAPGKRVRDLIPEIELQAPPFIIAAGGAGFTGTV